MDQFDSAIIAINCALHAIETLRRLKSEEYVKDQVIQGKWRGDRSAAKENLHRPEYIRTTVKRLATQEHPRPARQRIAEVVF